MSAHRVIAIDGPAASGKSTVARTLAQKLNFVYVNSGAFYRAATWYVMEKNRDAADESAVGVLIAEATIRIGIREAGSFFEIEGVVPPEAELRTGFVNANVSLVSKVPVVRERLTELLRSYAEEDDVVMEGRDIGSAVFPRTPYKFYIDASPEVRAQRRASQGQTDDLAARDRADSQRATAPLTIAEDAQVIDSSRLTVDGVVGEIIGRLKIMHLSMPHGL